MMIFLTKVDDDLLLDLECCNCKIEMLHYMMYDVAQGVMFWIKGIFQ